MGVSLDSDVPKVMQTLLECAQSHPKVVPHPAPKVYFKEFGESNLKFELQGWIAEVENMVEIKSELYQQVHRKFRSLEIKIPFPQQEIQVRTGNRTSGASQLNQLAGVPVIVGVR